VIIFGFVPYKTAFEFKFNSVSCPPRRMTPEFLVLKLPYGLIQVACNINDRPGKTLDYKTPMEMFFGGGVAFQT